MQGSKQIIIGTQKGNTMSDNISSVFGSGFLASLMPINVIVEIDVDEDESDNECDDERKCSASSTPTATDVMTVSPSSIEVGGSKTGDDFPE